MSVRIGIGELEDAIRYRADLDGLIERKRWDKYKHSRSITRIPIRQDGEGRRRHKKETILWCFPPELGEPLLEALQRARQRKEIALLQQLQELWERLPPYIEAYRAIWEPNCWRTVYIHPNHTDKKLLEFLLLVILHQEQIIPYTEEGEIDTYALQYLKSKCRDWEVARRTYETFLHNLGGYETWKALSLYLWDTVRGHRLNTGREDTSSAYLPCFLDEEPPVYDPRWVAQEHGCHEKTVKRWAGRHGGYTVAKNGKAGLSAHQYAAFQKYYAPKNHKKDLRERGKALGLSDAAIERGLKPDRRKNKSWENIQADLERSAAHQRRRNGDEVDPDFRADQLAELQALLLDGDVVSGSAVYVEIQDVLQRLLLETPDQAALMTEARL